MKKRGKKGALRNERTNFVKKTINLQRKNRRNDRQKI